MIDVPYYVRAKLCKCGNQSAIKFSDSFGVYVCRACQLFPAHLIRECAGCGTVYIKNFSHPQHCWRNPLCWDCLSDPLTEDIRMGCVGHEHFATYTYPPGTDWHDFIVEPKFPQPVAFDPNRPSVFSFKREPIGVDSA